MLSSLLGGCRGVPSTGTGSRLFWTFLTLGFLGICARTSTRSSLRRRHAARPLPRPTRRLPLPDTHEKVRPVRLAYWVDGIAILVCLYATFNAFVLADF